jgi:hypothetical protein
MNQAKSRRTTARAKAERKMFASIADYAGLARSISGGLTATLSHVLYGIAGLDLAMSPGTLSVSAGCTTLVARLPGLPLSLEATFPADPLAPPSLSLRSPGKLLGTFPLSADGTRDLAACIAKHRK